MNFEPVLFEANKVTFEHGKPLDISCFNEVKTCHIMILMIGGRYGSIISESDSEIERGIYDKEYISITRREYETALQNNIPTFIFIDKNVYGEYNTYKINRDFYENAIENSGFKFFHVDSINVLKFIDVVANKALKTFERIEEIEFYLKDQISGMFYLYLESLKQNNRQDEIFNAVTELKSLTSSMNSIIKEVGKKIIEPERYKEVINEQFSILLSYFFDTFYTYVDVDISVNEVDDNIIDKLVNFFMKEILTENTYQETSYTVFYNKTSHSKSDYNEFTQIRNEVLAKLNAGLNKLLPGFNLSLNIFKLTDDYIGKIKPLITSDDQEKDFLKALKTAIKYCDLPF